MRGAVGTVLAKWVAGRGAGVEEKRFRERGGSPGGECGGRRGGLGAGRLRPGPPVPHQGGPPRKRGENPACAETLTLPCCRLPTAVCRCRLVALPVANSKVFAALYQEGLPCG